jgi:hypothetical protein
MKSYDHTHKYQRTRLGSFKKSGHEIYKCMIPGCPHYMIDMEAVVGRYSQCWGINPRTGEDCDHEVEMTRFIVFNEKRKRPICYSCKEERKLSKLSKSERERVEARMRAIDKLMSERGSYGI